MSELSPLPPAFARYAAAAPQRHRRLRRLLVSLALAACLAACAAAVLRALWPTERLLAGTGALARVELAPFGERVSGATIVLPTGGRTGVRVRSSSLLPTAPLPQGTRIRLELTVTRSAWLGWLLGSRRQIELTLTTPVTHLPERVAHLAPGRPLTLAFTAPVSLVSVHLGSGRPRLLHLSPPRSRVVLVPPADTANAGSAWIAAAPRAWERLGRTGELSWFPLTRTPELLVRPAPSETLAPGSPLVLTFSQPVAQLLGRVRPRLWPATPGSWHEPDADTLVFDPSGLGFPLGAHLRLGLRRAFRVVAGDDPASERTLSWRVAPGSSGRLEQVLGSLGYLPVAWSGSAALPRGAAALAAAAVSPPSGSARWRFHTPAALRALWDSPQGRPILLRGALMAFQSAQGLEPSGVMTPLLWRALLADVLAGRRSPYGYSYVYVTETLPETLMLWHDGRVVLRAAVNTGIPAAPTETGTYPVYLHLASTTMSGTNPDGSHYSDPGVPWVNYFNGGDAVHGFVRPGYGYPQSLGCVEAPPATAAQIWPYVQVGTLVTVAA